MTDKYFVIVKYSIVMLLTCLSKTRIYSNIHEAEQVFIKVQDWKVYSDVYEYFPNTFLTIAVITHKIYYY
jgi:hypothetical protein